MAKEIKYKCPTGWTWDLWRQAMAMCNLSDKHFVPNKESSKSKTTLKKVKGAKDE